MPSAGDLPHGRYAAYKPLRFIAHYVRQVVLALKGLHLIGMLLIKPRLMPEFHRDLIPVSISAQWAIYSSPLGFVDEPWWELKQHHP